VSLSPTIAKSFERQADWCRKLGSPFTGLVCDLLARRLDAGSRFGARIHHWQGSAAADALALRAAGALNALARSGAVPELTLAYPPNPGSTPDELWLGIVAAVRKQDAFLQDYLDSPPQTNEVARSSAILSGCLVVASCFRQPIEVLEIGASAGLNLGFDRYRYDLAGRHWGDHSSPVRLAPSWEGDEPPLDAPLSVELRAGCDIAPLDPALRSDRERLLSYIWPDQARRLARIERALDLAAAAPWRVEQADAAEWLEGRLGVPQPGGRTRILFHSIMWQYTPKDTQARILAAIEKAGAVASEAAPFAWLRLEPDSLPDGAAITLDLWPARRRIALGRGDYHGQWVKWAGAPGTRGAALAAH
jgi:hypothetical protein